MTDQELKPLTKEQVEKGIRKCSLEISEVNSGAMRILRAQFIVNDIEYRLQIETSPPSMWRVGQATGPTISLWQRTDKSTHYGIPVPEGLDIPKWIALATHTPQESAAVGHYYDEMFRKMRDERAEIERRYLERE